MMQDDSNGEASFEFVERKLEGISLVDNALRQGKYAVLLSFRLFTSDLPRVIFTFQ